DVSGRYEVPLSSVVVLPGSCRAASSNHITQITDCNIPPLRRIAKLRKAEAGAGFAFAGVELLHQAALVRLRLLYLAPLRGNQLIQRRQAVGNFLLLGHRRQTNRLFGVIREVYVWYPGALYILLQAQGTHAVE